RLALPTRVTQLSVTQIEEFVANSGHKKLQLVNGYRKAAERAKDHRQIAPANLHKCGGGEEEKEEEVFPLTTRRNGSTCKSRGGRVPAASGGISA
ncbi:hypothetical protein B0H13DRAFT_2667275, partial [Mycena leptocephala]